MTIRVLVVDDSAFARKVVREVLSTAPDLEVVDIARDGAEALEKIAALAPDVITLDLVMPDVDGLGVLRALADRDGPAVVVVSVSGRDTELGLDALALGAFAVVAKPTALATDRLYELGAPLIETVRLAASRRRAPAPVVPVRPPPLAAGPSGPIELVAIGTSTGGPSAISHLLAALPGGFPAPIAIVVHLPAEYTGPFARRLDASSALRVFEARDGDRLGPGDVAIAPGGQHLRITREGGALVARLADEPSAVPHRPSVDELFASVARACGPAALGVVLTGMGDDGCAGARALVAAGARVLTESAASCVVYGMPRCVVEAGLSAGEVALEELAAGLVARCAAAAT